MELIRVQIIRKCSKNHIYRSDHDNSVSVADLRTHPSLQHRKNTNDPVLVRDYTVGIFDKLHSDNQEVLADALSTRATLRRQAQEDVRPGGRWSHNFYDLGLEWQRWYPLRHGLGVHSRQQNGILRLHAYNHYCRQSAHGGKFQVEKVNWVHSWCSVWLNQCKFIHTEIVFILRNCSSIPAPGCHIYTDVIPSFSHYSTQCVAVDPHDHLRCHSPVHYSGHYQTHADWKSLSRNGSNERNYDDWH